MKRKPTIRPSIETAPVHLEGFEAIEPIGSGGYSRVYRARQEGFDREVALKIMSFGIETSAQQRSFERECRAMGVLSQHPNIVTVFNATMTDTSQPCIVMEFYAGGTLGDRVKQRGPLDAAEVLSIGVQVAGALQTAHDRGVIHRDIKPQNLFLSDYGRPALGDFGISSFDDDRTLTGGGEGLTVHYAPPELIEGTSASAVSDVYSLAATLFSLATGRRPYPRPMGQTVGELARRIVVEPPPRLPAGVGPPQLADLLQRGMAKDADDRPRSAADFGSELQAIERAWGLVETAMPLASEHGSPSIPALGPTMAAPVAQLERGDEETVAPALDKPAVFGRRLRAWSLAAVVLVVLAALSLVAGDADVAAPTATTSKSATTDQFFSAPTAPTGVVIVWSSDDSVEISWLPSDDARGYQVVRVDTDEVVEVFDPSAVLKSDGGARPCVRVTAIGVDGKLSQPSDAVCVS